MRIEQVVPNLYLGGCMNDAETVLRTVDTYGLTHILNLDERSDYDKLVQAGRRGEVEVLQYDIDDDGTDRPMRWCITGIWFGYEVLQDPGNRLFVHCAAGHNRSPSMVYGILRACGYSESDAEALIADYCKRVDRRRSNGELKTKVTYKSNMDAAIETLRPLIGHNLPD